MIEVLSAGALATVQDLGRTGALNLGVGTSGAMDPLALAAGNILLRNEENAAALEIPLFPFRVRFTRPTVFAVTGADCAPQLDEAPVLPWWAHRADAGQVLALAVPSAATWRACRAYLCIAGGIDVPLVLGSRSTQLRGAFGGLEGRPLRDGDGLPIVATSDRAKTGFGITPPGLALPSEVDGLPAVRVLPAAEYDSFAPSSHEALWSEPWKITSQSDRYGYRLAGPELRPQRPMELRSHGIVPGVIQVPHGGQPIIQMRDAQPSGGYPKIGTVIDADLWRLGQAPIGSRIRFVLCNWDEALDALAATRRWLSNVRRLVELYCDQGAVR
ncbi:biotin-dependent carboxyltransferase family protein [Bradyrhizobium sp. SHOUNA76]|uniref:5-oxoprolinase subunit C family protein n=2 Tax=unclassified Bradyrhizobium TaxID=2631580 RepID=UPI001FF1384D|nr:biotin-dependent carboxyltransferase family protein [Bradyrhizobium sp. SHOUNA76]MCJ9706460.1 biotin-dependent carboxyltransferase family protein [Bradyrhizobium sp. SHOUNA76]